MLVLALLVVSLLGPWGFVERINVPAQYDCNPPWIRLEGDFCGMTYTGLEMIGLGGSALAALAEGQASSSIGVRDIFAALAIVLLITLLLLPYIITLVRLLTGDRRPGSGFSLAAWGLAAAAGALIMMSDPSQPAHLKWGLWLLTGLALVMLVVEARRLWMARRSLLA
jgi:hypothetical protein